MKNLLYIQSKLTGILRVSDPLELELQVVLSLSKWVLETNLGYYGKLKAVSTTEPSLCHLWYFFLKENVPTCGQLIPQYVVQCTCLENKTGKQDL